MTQYKNVYNQRVRLGQIKKSALMSKRASEVFYGVNKELEALTREFLRNATKKNSKK